MNYACQDVGNDKAFRRVIAIGSEFTGFPLFQRSLEKRKSCHVGARRFTGSSSKALDLYRAND
jgi:hypothetical protein